MHGRHPVAVRVQTTVSGVDVHTFKIMRARCFALPYIHAYLCVAKSTVGAYCMVKSLHTNITPFSESSFSTLRIVFFRGPRTFQAPLFPPVTLPSVCSVQFFVFWRLFLPKACAKWRGSTPAANGSPSVITWGAKAGK